MAQTPYQELMTALRYVCDLESRIEPMRKIYIHAVENQDKVRELTAYMNQKAHFIEQLKNYLRTVQEQNPQEDFGSDGLLAEVGVQMAMDEVSHPSGAYECFERALYRKVADLAVRAGISEVSRVCLEILEYHHVNPKTVECADDNAHSVVPTKNGTQEELVDARLLMLRHTEPTEF